jgi:hypothetical protein
LEATIICPVRSSRGSSEVIRMRATIYMLVLLTMSSCERDTAVKLEGGNPPVFVLSGSGTLRFAVIHGSKRMRSNEGDRDFAVWEIHEPDPEHARVETRVERMGSVTYGKVPDGYKQIYPENDGEPPVLVEGAKYEYWFETADANGARGYFRIKDGKREYLGQ